MRNKQFQEIVEKVRLESFRSTSTALGQNEEAHIKHFVNRFYEWLFFDYNWPFLKIPDADKAILAGSFKYDPPASIDLERIEKVDVLYGGVWQPVERGISMDEYNQMSPEDNERFDPILKYDIWWTGSAPQIIVWPRPASATTLRFQGRKAFMRLVSNTDICLLDDTLIALFCAAELLAQDENPRAEAVLTAARQRYNILKFGYDKNRGSKFNLQGQPPAKDYSKFEIRVAHVEEN